MVVFFCAAAREWNSPAENAKAPQGLAEELRSG
jgi:hypothetical protein